jgi:curved DNA-binding protein CbpA
LDGANYYEVLEISRYANQQEIKSAFRRLARRYHPDRNSTVSDDIMKNINIAFEILSDPGKRQQYDESLGGERPRKLERPDQNREGNSTSNQNSWQVHTISDDLDSQTGSYHNEVDVNFESRLNAEDEATSLGKDNTVLESRYRIIVEPSLCLAFGSCETLAPKVFVVEKDRRINPKAIVISETAEDFETILDAAKTCPTKAIFIIDRYTGERIFP